MTEKRVTNEEVREFYKNANPNPNVTKKYMQSGLGQSKGGYVGFAKICKTKRADEWIEGKNEEERKNIENYNKISQYLENAKEQLYDLSFLYDISDIKVLDIRNIERKSDEPEINQKWHLYVSLFAQSVVSEPKFRWDCYFKKYPCLELKLWMAEEAGVNVENVLEAIQEKKEGKIVNDIIRKIDWDDIFNKILMR